MTTVRVGELRKRFGATVALDGLDLEIGVGVTGLLGPNGAGKTTLLRCLATVLAPDHGRIEAYGLDPADSRQRTALRRRLGYLPQSPGLYPNFSAAALLGYVAVLKEIVDPRQRRTEVHRALEEVGLSDRANVKVRKLSGGMRQRLGVAQALLGHPDLIILDEPTVGLDPEQRMFFRTLISRLGETRTVLLSTHQTEDAGALCERVVVLREGRAVFDGAPRALAQLAEGQVWRSAGPPEGRTMYWRTAEGDYRTLGPQPPDGVAVPPSIEDGYLKLLGPAPAAGTIR
ncbi:ATP-binding cassette domain-containing protein [Winogradskya consettensis]|uniref:ATP-binding cassette domain-containing protein n=1 Tax=Winogradskya consettensis TaxID=113560 RepID=UPI001BB36F87|nr:ATP-binding cassette domain-containing protein [Actinoplanes consettensis]